MAAEGEGGPPTGRVVGGAQDGAGDLGQGRGDEVVVAVPVEVAGAAGIADGHGPAAAVATDARAGGTIRGRDVDDLPGAVAAVGGAERAAGQVADELFEAAGGAVTIGFDGRTIDAAFSEAAAALVVEPLGEHVATAVEAALVGPHAGARPPRIVLEASRQGVGAAAADDPAGGIVVGEHLAAVGPAEAGDAAQGIVVGLGGGGRCIRTQAAGDLAGGIAVEAGDDVGASVGGAQEPAQGVVGIVLGPGLRARGVAVADPAQQSLVVAFDAGAAVGEGGGDGALSGSGAEDRGAVGQAAVAAGPTAPAVGGGERLRHRAAGAADGAQGADDLVAAARVGGDEDLALVGRDAVGGADLAIAIEVDGGTADLAVDVVLGQGGDAVGVDAAAGPALGVEAGGARDLGRRAAEAAGGLPGAAEPVTVDVRDVGEPGRRAALEAGPGPLGIDT